MNDNAWHSPSEINEQMMKAYTLWRRVETTSSSRETLSVNAVTAPRESLSCVQPPGSISQTYTTPFIRSCCHSVLQDQEHLKLQGNRPGELPMQKFQLDISATPRHSTVNSFTQQRLPRLERGVSLRNLAAPFQPLHGAWCFLIHFRLVRGFLYTLVYNDRMFPQLCTVLLSISV